jgi:hypothetical protein
MTDEILLDEGIDKNPIVLAALWDFILFIFEKWTDTHYLDNGLILLLRIQRKLDLSILQYIFWLASSGIDFDRKRNFDFHHILLWKFAE